MNRACLPVTEKDLVIIKCSTINAKDNKLTLTKRRKSLVPSEQACVRFATILARFARESRPFANSL